LMKLTPGIKKGGVSRSFLTFHFFFSGFFG
jgi:hypothetical protein